MDAGGDGSDFVSTAGRRSGDSRPGASDSEAIDLHGSSASCSHGGDGGWSSIGRNAESEWVSRSRGKEVEFAVVLAEAARGHPQLKWSWSSLDACAFAGYE